MPLSDLSADLSTPEGIVSASVAGTLLNAIAAAPYVEEESLADELAKLHNTGVIDILKIYRSDELVYGIWPNLLPGSKEYSVKILPQVQCSVEDATATCKSSFRQGRKGSHLAAALVYDALRELVSSWTASALLGGVGLGFDCDMTIETGIYPTMSWSRVRLRDSSRVHVGEAL